jgi:hypothetical protein
VQYKDLYGKQFNPGQASGQNVIQLVILRDASSFIFIFYFIVD